MSEAANAGRRPDQLERGTTNLPRLVWLALIFAVATLIFLIRAFGNTDLESYGQPMHIGYLLDLMTRGSVLVQHDLDNGLMSAPPLHTWAMAPFAAMLGFSRWAVILPSFLAILATAVLVFEAGRRQLGDMPAALSATAFLLSPATAKAIALAGPDALLALIVGTGMLAAVSASSKPASDDNSSQTLWIAAALATLTTGFTGALLVACALLAAYWQSRRMTSPVSASWGRVAGPAVFVSVVVAWSVPAGISHGFATVLPTLVTAEAIRQSSDWLRPIAALLLRNLPFSLFLIAALWRIARHPSTNDEIRRFERFLAAWLLFALLAASLTNPPLSDPTFPLWPVGALLAGKEMAHLAQRMGNTKFAGVAVIIACFLIGATYNAAHSLDTGGLKSSELGREMALARDAELAAEAIKTSGIETRTLTHLGTPRTLQFYLGTFQPRVDREALGTILASSNNPVLLATVGTYVEALATLQAQNPTPEHVFKWPADIAQPALIQIVRITRGTMPTADH